MLGIIYYIKTLTPVTVCSLGRSEINKQTQEKKLILMQTEKKDGNTKGGDAGSRLWSHVTSAEEFFRVFERQFDVRVKTHVAPAVRRSDRQVCVFFFFLSV